MDKENKENSKKMESNQITRPPVVVVLGHVDHGKTRLLDTIRKTNVAGKEAGGITQHIGAYQIKYNGKIITFLDTPGHEAFSAIRSRGAKVADIAILVVAADEGVKPQTKEAIKHIKNAGIPFIVAINKIDKEGANPNMVKQQLAEAEVFVEGWGGQVSVVEIAAKFGKNIDELLELILLTAEMEELKADLNKNAEGVIIESHLDSKRGFVATLLIQDGTLMRGDYIVSGGTYMRVKSIEDFMGKIIDKGIPSQPVLTLGWSESPDVGEKFLAVKDKKEAENLAEQALRVEQPLFIKQTGPVKDNKEILNVVFKADTRGSLEALSEAVKYIDHEEVGYNVVGYGIGNINDNDIKTLAANKGIIYGFCVGVEDSAKVLAEKEGIKIKIFPVIYELIEELKRDLSELLEPEIKRTVLGKIKVLRLFKKDQNYQIVGGKVTFGTVKKGALIDVLRGDVKIISGRLAQLQHNKVDVEEVKEGLECGVRFEGTPEIQEGDILEVYEEEKIKRNI